jgi:hypothetical protein
MSDTDYDTIPEESFITKLKSKYNIDFNTLTYGYNPTKPKPKKAIIDGVINFFILNLSFYMMFLIKYHC